MNPIANNPKDFWTGTVYITVGALALLFSRDLDMGTAVKMGPAYFPTILSAILILVGLISVVRSFLKPGSPIGKVAWKGLTLVIMAVLLFGLTARKGGLAISLPLIVIVSALASTRFSWKFAIPLAIGATVFSILVFQVGLGVPLPIFGEWFTD